jgi:hypothetical protein
VLGAVLGEPSSVYPLAKVLGVWRRLKLEAYPGHDFVSSWPPTHSDVCCLPGDFLEAGMMVAFCSALSLEHLVQKTVWVDERDLCEVGDPEWVSEGERVKLIEMKMKMRDS